MILWDEVIGYRFVTFVKKITTKIRKTSIFVTFYNLSKYL